MNKTVLINGSPKRNKAVSDKYLAIMSEGLSENVGIQELYIYGMELNNEEFDILKGADSIVMALPLYVDGVPARVVEFMKAFKESGSCSGSAKPKFYFIINCGFMEHEQNDVAIRILKNFAVKSGFEFCGGVSIGSGAMILGTSEAEEAKSLLTKLAEKVEKMESSIEIFETNVKIPKEKFQKIFNQVWIDVAAKKGLTEEDLKSRYF